MREIKFRAWDLDEKCIHPWTGNGEWDGLMPNFRNAYLNKRLVWMQYTGLKDKNGKEIYEGDIVKVPYYGDIKRAKIEEVVVHFDNSFECEPFNTYNYSEDGYSYPNQSEIIGNKYENKDLL